jgi:hypothetical protein
MWEEKMMGKDELGNKEDGPVIQSLFRETTYDLWRLYFNIICL